MQVKFYVWGGMMKVQCALCEQIEQIDKHSLKAKRLKNRRLELYYAKLVMNEFEIKQFSVIKRENFVYIEKKCIIRNSFKHKRPNGSNIRPLFYCASSVLPFRSRWSLNL